MIKLSINHMVCPRCVEAVEQVMQQSGVTGSCVKLGSVELEARLPEEKLDEVNNRLKERGFELVFDRESEIVNHVKAAVIQYLEHIEESRNPKRLSDFLSQKTHYNYSYMSKVFSDAKGKTIESYYIEMKIERVKELLSFKKFTLSEIAWKLKYSSVQYLSNQFKKVTGSTVSEYLKQEEFSRKSIDQL